MCAMRPSVRFLASLLTLICAEVIPGAAAAGAEELPEPLTAAVSDATLITPEPIDGDALPLDPQPYVNDEPWYTPPARRAPWYFARLRGGASYFDVPDESRLGGEYGGDVIVPLIGRNAGYANLSINHYSGGTQVLGQVGLMGAGSPCADDWTDRLGWLVVFDQFTDTRFDDLYVSSLQAGLSYTVDANTLVGAVYTEPLEDDEIEILIPGATAVSGDVSQSRAVRAYLSRRFDSTLVSGWIGYRDVANTMLYGGSVRHSISDRISTVVQATYQDVGIWSAFAGIEVALGRSPDRCGSDNPSCASRSTTGDGEIVRGGGFSTRKEPAYYVMDGQIYETDAKYKMEGSERELKKPYGTYPLYQSVGHLLQFNPTIRDAGDYGSQMNISAPPSSAGVSDCEALVTQLLAQFAGDIEAVRNELINLSRTDCLNDPRLNP
jgi:hypothetical protein